MPKIRQTYNFDTYVGEKNIIYVLPGQGKFSPLINGGEFWTERVYLRLV